MKKLTIKEIGKIKSNPVFKGLPDSLKDTKEFVVVEKRLANVMLSDHKHQVIATFVKCKRCQVKFHKKRALLKELGFDSINQYQSYKKVMQAIISKKNISMYVRESK